MATPIVGLVSCTLDIEGFTYNGVMSKYVDAVKNIANCTPVIVPAHKDAAMAVLNELDGLLLTGSVSNVHPKHYLDDYGPVEFDLDERRDDTTLALVREAFDQDVPIFAICRGIQELNVAMGGSLRTDVSAIAGSIAHHPAEETSIEKMFEPSHSVSFEDNGFLARLTGNTSACVNSVHKQCLDRVAPVLRVDAVTGDNVVEAVWAKDKPFVFGVQWHPEWEAEHNALSTALFEKFGSECRKHKQPDQKLD